MRELIEESKTDAPLAEVSRPARVVSATAPRRLMADRVARILVVAGGMAIIACILAILVFIAVEVAPLLRGARVETATQIRLDAEGSTAVMTDEYREHLAVLGVDGIVRVYNRRGGPPVLERPLTDGARVTSVSSVSGQSLLAGLAADNRVFVARFDWDVQFDEQRRRIEPRIDDPAIFEIGESATIQAWSASLDANDAGAAVAATADGRLVVVRRDVETNAMTGQTITQFSRGEGPLTTPVTLLVLDPSLSYVFAANSAGQLVWWELNGAEPGVPRLAGAGGAGVSALALLNGGRSLVVGRNDGTIEIWFIVRESGGQARLERARSFPARGGAIQAFAPSMRDKGFLALDASGAIGLYHSTSGRLLWDGRTPLEAPQAIVYAPKADGAFVLDISGRAAELAIDNPHPEVSLSALFGKVWYESYPEPAWVWQSTGGSDEFEPKLSLVPLMIGTLKGTLYSLILAIPLGVLGAMFTSQFMSPGIRGIVKPTVEIMAALPSVVLGFLAGLWLAPRVERAFPGFLLMLILLPLIVLATWSLLRALPRRWRGRFAPGFEIVPYMITMSLGMGLCLALAGPFENIAFGGHFSEWLLNVTGLAYDQRNAVVVGMAMGFAVVPVIFAISEDAFSNVPRTLVSGSLALGANRWQTVTRVVLPTASPGIFSAVMIGFGRAVGETMIVLMATGNTPILDWSPFNGFRTLSANIATEIPEAPHGGTLYRMLFLSALILFVFTFLINTLAEIVRQRLRRRYSEI